MHGLVSTLIALASQLLAPAPSPAGAQQPRTHTIEIKDFKFAPETARVRTGDTIVFANRDVVPHTATRQQPGWDSGALAKDAAWSFTAGATGTIDYICRFHPGMTGRLVVE